MTRTLAMPQADESQRTQTQRRSNLRLAWVLFSIALAFGAGFVAKIALFSR